MHLSQQPPVTVDYGNGLVRLRGERDEFFDIRIGTRRKHISQFRSLQCLRALASKPRGALFGENALEHSVTSEHKERIGIV